jgi:Putative metallopeptidase
VIRRLTLALILLATAACGTLETNSEQDTTQKGRIETAGSDFVEGNLYFLAYHELGHALISELDIPVTGREEDAVDRIAIWMMIPQSGDEQPDYLLNAMQGWFSLSDQSSWEEIQWWGEHGTNQQRGYQIACLLFGSDPQRYRQLAEDTGLPPERQETCVWEFQQNETAWDKLLMPHVRAEGETGPAESVVVTYDDTQVYRTERDYLKGIELLENVATLIRDNYRLTPGIRIVAEECGQANAFWNVEDRKIVICYELVEDYRAITVTG